MRAAAAGWRGLLLLTLLGLAVFGNALRAPFQYDDLHSIEFNPYIRTLSGVGDHFVDSGTFSSRTRGFMYRPVLMTSYSLDYALWGTQPTGFRVTNLILHVIASALFAVLAGRWIGARAGVGAAILFLVHPLHGEAVDYVSSRSDLLVAVFALACLVVLRALSAWPLLVLYVGALLSKSVAVTVPVIAAALAWARHGWRGLHPDRWRYLLLVLSTVTYLSILWGTRFLVSSYGKLPRQPLAEFWTQSKALVYYSWLGSSPVQLSVDHPFAVAVGPGSPVVAASLLLLLSIAILSLRHRACLPARGMFFFGIAMIPYLVVPLNIVVAERRVYLASCGLFLIGIWAWTEAERRWGSALRPVGVGLCIVLALLTIERNAVWASDVSLWRDAVKKNPVSARPRMNLGLAHKRQGDLVEARRQLDEGLRLDPGFAEGWVVLGQLRLSAGDVTGATLAYRKAARLDPTMAGVHHNLGNVAMQLGQIDSAVVHFGRVLELDPNFVEARNNLGQALEQQGRWPDALSAYRRAVSDSVYWVNTDDPVGGAWFNRARAADHLGLYAEALQAYGQARRRLGADERYQEYARQAGERLEQLLRQHPESAP